MKQFRSFILGFGLVSFLLLSPQAFAASSADSEDTETPAVDRSTSESNSGLKKFEENHEITDAQLKAQAGSRSVFSTRFNLAYYGPGIGDLSALNQPNPDGVVTVSAVAISGNAGFRYRLDPSTSLSLYAGVSDLYPFREQQTLDVNSPTLSFDKSFRLGGMQFVSSPGVQWVTQNTYKNAGEVWGLSYVGGTVYNIGTSGFAVGSDMTLGYWFFNRDYNKKIDKGAVRRANLGLNPGVKYNINDRLNVSTTVGITIYNARNMPDSVLSRKASERLSVGYAFTRDIYVSPYVQFYPDQMAWRTTTINVSTTFSIL